MLIAFYDLLPARQFSPKLMKHLRQKPQSFLNLDHNPTYFEVHIKHSKRGFGLA